MSALPSRIGTGRPSLGALFRLAIAAGVPRAVEIQIRRGAPLDGRDAVGRSPLMLAALRGHVDLCRMLLASGATATLVDDAGCDAVLLARSRGHTGVADLIAAWPEAAGVDRPARPETEGLPSRPGDDGGAPQGSNVDVSRSVPVDAGPAGRKDEAEPGGHAVLSSPPREPDPGPPRPGTAEICVSSVAAMGPGVVEPPSGQGIESGGFVTAKAEQAGRDDQLNPEEPAALLSHPVGPDVAPPGADGPETADPFLMTTGPGEAEPLPEQDVDAPPAAAADAGQAGWDDGWEPEEDDELSGSDPAIAAAADTLHLHMAAHVPVLDGADWTDIEVDLPVSRGLWARGFREDFDAVRHLGRLLDAALFEGRATTGAIAEFLSNTPSGSPDERLERHLAAALDSIGILVDEEETSALSDGPPAVSRGRAAHDRSISREVLEFLDGMAGEPTSDLALIEMAMRRFPPPPSAAEELRLFQEHQAALDGIILAAARHPAARVVVTEWLRRVGSGDMPVQDMFVHAIDEPQDQEVVGTGASTPPSAVTALGTLVTTVQAAPAAMQHRLLADGLVALRLAAPRILEMAEAVCPHLGAARPVERRMLTARRHVPVSMDGPVAADTAQAAIVDALRQAVDHYLRRRDLIVAVNLRMVVWQGRRHVGAGLQIGDIVHEGTFGLLRAIQRFDHAKGIRFGTYAIWWIRQAMSRSRADTGRTIRLPVHLQEKCSRLGKLEGRLVRTLGRQPDPSELATALGESVEVVRRLQRSMMEIVPLDQVLADEKHDLQDEAPLAQPAGLVDFEPSPLDRLLHADLRASLEHGLSRIDQRQRRILVLRFGLEDGIPRTLEEVGQIYGVTRERIRQIEAKTLLRLRRLLPSKTFEAMQP